MNPYRLTLAVAALSLSVALAGCGKPGGGAGGPIHADQISWSKVAENNDQSFDAEAPDGWKTSTGVLYTDPAEGTPWLTTASPDGATLIYVNDPTLTIFTTQGQQEGQQVQNIFPMTVLQYRTAAQFAQMYGASTLPSQCADVKFVSAEQRPDLAQIEASKPQQTLGDAAVAHFTCTVDGKPYSAGVVALTPFQQNVSMGIWGATVMGYRTPQGQEAAADSVLSHILTSFNIHPAWSQRLAQAAQNEGAQSRQVLRDNWADFGKTMSAQEQQTANLLQSGHDAYMAASTAAANQRNANFAVHEYNKGVQAHNFLMMVRGTHMANGPNGPVEVPN
jgi:hypothetical protein